MRRFFSSAEVPSFEPERALTPPATPQLVRQYSGEADMDTPYSVGNEVRFFLKMGIPLTLSALLNWGLPSLVGMVFAGHTEDSAHLQAAVGYGRVWFNCTTMVPTVSFIQYLYTMLPSCIGAKRKDRIGSYMKRSLLMTFLCMIPIYALQFVSGPILQALGIPADIAAEVHTYNLIMIVTNWFQICNMHMEALVTNLEYAKSTTVVSFLGGGLQVLCSYTFIYRLGWGMVGNAIGGILVEFGRSTVFITLILAFGLLRKLRRAEGTVISEGADSAPEPLVSWKDFLEFLSLTGPQFLSNLGGWVVFEFQMLALANIRGISKDALAAGAAWVQLEGTLAASQQGWLASCSIRSVRLLGKGDPGAAKAFTLFQVMASTVVGVSNVFLFIFREEICRMMSEDAAVQGWLEQIFWVLIIHTQTRICSCSSVCLFIPAGRGKFQIFWTFASFYFVASPIAGIVALTDLVTNSMAPKMLACVGLTSIAQTMQLVVFYIALCGMDWQEASAIVNGRVNDDRQQEDAQTAEAGERGQACANGLRETAIAGA